MLSIRFVSSAMCPRYFFFNDTATTEIYTLSLHDALPISLELTHVRHRGNRQARPQGDRGRSASRSEEHTSELQSRLHLVCRLLLEKKKSKRASALDHVHHLRVM